MEFISFALAAAVTQKTKVWPNVWAVDQTW
jgi:hypothetical protein